MRRFLNRLAQLVAAPAIPLVSIALVIRGEWRDCLEPFGVWWHELVEGD